ncbi:M48 family metalloprotease [Hymenobacter sp. J193]|uniref:M48 family metalloprotease n=1 Tax=Hymenobacter sp. J193 TaxID=2898429 RepID=UPI00215136CF|nr:M48 family metalloprotease [Hymenobacter sp. J193]MCR5889190.1 M48 family metalloprotease [Hymenobacter sp. J193]
MQETSTQAYNAIRHSALLDSLLNPAVQRVFKAILQANPQLPAARLVLTRNPEPNARAVGNSTIILHVGLLPALENESQLAFILCHELAHIQSRHMETALATQLTALHSREFRREVRRIVQAEYSINSHMKNLVMGMSLNQAYHQRRHERQADSLGYVLLRRTRYKAPQAYRTLELLNTIDKESYQDALPLNRVFSCPEVAHALTAAPASAASIFTVKPAEKTLLETSDTLKSHPDCAKRMHYLRTLTQDQLAEGPQAVEPGFSHLREASRLEVLQSWFDTSCYDHALFEALRLLRQQPQSEYLRSVVVLSLYELHRHLQEHRFTEVVANVSKHQPEPFNEFLRVLNSLRLADYTALTACLAQSTEAPPTATNEYALAARYAAAALANDQAQAATLLHQYQARFSAGRFSSLLFPPRPSKINH